MLVLELGRNPDEDFLERGLRDAPLGDDMLAFALFEGVEDPALRNSASSDRWQTNK